MLLTSFALLIDQVPFTDRQLDQWPLRTIIMYKYLASSYKPCGGWEYCLSRLETRSSALLNAVHSNVDYSITAIYRLEHHVNTIDHTTIPFARLFRALMKPLLPSSTDNSA